MYIRNYGINSKVFWSIMVNLNKHSTEIVKKGLGTF